MAVAKDMLIGRRRGPSPRSALPGAEKSIRVPFLGGVHAAVSNITLFHLDVGDDSALRLGDSGPYHDSRSSFLFLVPTVPETWLLCSGLVVVASGVSANISMAWSYSYDSWYFGPLQISDSGTASILVQGMEVGITMEIKNYNGSLALNVSQCGCYVKDLEISLDGGASWFYQGSINAFEDDIRAAVEKVVPENIIGSTSKLDSFLQGLPRSVSLDNITALNMTFMNDPQYGNSSIEFDINGLFTSAVAKTSNLQKHPQLSLSCGGASNMLLLSLDETVFSSALDVYYKVIKHMIIDVLHGTETVPVACISVVVSASGVVEASGNKVYGRFELNDFSLSLKWSKIGNFHMSLIQGVIRVFLNTACMPYLNSQLGHGFILPVVHGFILKDVYMITSTKQLTLCSDITFANVSSLASLPVL
ncbi:hypothetical protein ACQ4PT_009103 [Festuca glaucescens]